MNEVYKDDLFKKENSNNFYQKSKSIINIKKIKKQKHENEKEKVIKSYDIET